MSFTKDSTIISIITSATFSFGSGWHARETRLYFIILMCKKTMNNKYKNEHNRKRIQIQSSVKINIRGCKWSMEQMYKLNENIWCNTCSFMQHDWPLKRLKPKALSIKGTGKPWSGISLSSCAKLWSFILFYSRLYTLHTHTKHTSTLCPASTRHYERHATVSFRNWLSSGMGQYQHYRQVSSFRRSANNAFDKTLLLIFPL